MKPIPNIQLVILAAFVIALALGFLLGAILV